MTACNVYWTFAGPINEAAAERFVRQLPFMMQMSAEAVHHISLQTSGGTIGDGIWLFNFLKSFPRASKVYNAGTIASIGTIAYLGAPRRIASAHAAFMIHRSTYTALPANAAHLANGVRILAMEDKRTEAILRDQVRLTAAQWCEIDRHELWLTAQDAVAAGLVHEIGEFTPPEGGTVLAI